MDKPTLLQQQTAMGLYLRDPEHRAPPRGMNVERAQVYRDLIFANLSSLLSGTFPVLIKILGDDGWRTLVRRFLRDHRAKTPKFPEIAQAFVAFLASEPSASAAGEWPPFMVELAHYEWVEMVLQQSDAEPLPSSDGALILQRPLQVSPLAWPLAYRWPVQLVGPDFQPDTAPVQPTLLLIRRTADWSIKFSELSPLAWRLLQRIGEFPALEGRVQLEALAAEANTHSAEFMQSGAALLQQLCEEGVVGLA
ncbi:DNA-binding domain-containing protein [Pseudomonas sp. NPDC086278]|uniref:HvfC family RiPP maturation protein n=1 Tax=Pseudomonas sp. NPDC086278 TaxID=3390646 RepID=UPI003CFC3B9C